MEFFTKFFVFSVLVAGTCGRSLDYERSLSNSTEVELENTTQEEIFSNSTDSSIETTQEDIFSNSTDSSIETTREDIFSNSTDSSIETTQEDIFSNSADSSIETTQEDNVSNRTEDTECNCNWRYFKHYETKGCFIEQFDSCWCPKKFRCPENQTLQVSSKVCVYKNKEYQVGSKIITSNACHVCRCRDGEPPSMSCISKDCPTPDLTPGKNCHLVYKENSCCAVGVECLESENEDEDEVGSIQTCEYNGNLYPFGSKIYPENDPCQICICNENWNGVDNSSCYHQDCVLERKKNKLDEGCIPVYHENRCCPIEFYCPSSHNFSYSVLPNNETQNNEISNDHKCSFGDQLYDFGTEMSMDNPCVTCSCDVPPDFTCIHRSCPPSPNEENCFPVYSPSNCCPTYECLMGDAQPDSEREGCPTPLCAHSGCRIGTPPGHECPTCICDERVSELEHNNVQHEQQQIQQIGQNMEQFHEMYEGGPRGAAEDYAEDELQMMPIRMQDAESQFSVMDKIVLPESGDIERNSEEEIRELDELDGSYSERDSYTEPDAVESEEGNIEENMISMIESEKDYSGIESDPNDTGKEVQKRSDITDAPGAGQLEIDLPFEQQESIGQVEMEKGDIERESENSEGDENFDDELESFKNRLFAKNNTIINEIININHVVEVPVPDGCPTPMCEGPWCRVGIPEGHKCPTCICKRHNEP